MSTISSDQAFDLHFQGDCKELRERLVFGQQSSYDRAGGHSRQGAYLSQRLAEGEPAADLVTDRLRECRDLHRFSISVVGAQALLRGHVPPIAT